MYDLVDINSFQHIQTDNMKSSGNHFLNVSLFPSSSNVQRIGIEQNEKEIKLSNVDLKLPEISKFPFLFNPLFSNILFLDWHNSTFIVPSSSVFDFPWSPYNIFLGSNCFGLFSNEI